VLIGLPFTFDPDPGGRHCPAHRLRWEWIGGCLFLLLAAGYVFEASGNLPSILAISGPLSLFGRPFPGQHGSLMSGLLTGR